MRMNNIIERAFAENRSRLERAKAALSALDPEKTLERGYALVFDPDTGTPFTTSKLPEKTLLSIKFADGTVNAETLKIQEKTE